MIVLPTADYIDIRTPDGKLVCRYHPGKHVVEWKHQQKVYYFDLAEIAKSYRGRNGEGDTDTAVSERLGLPEGCAEDGETGVPRAQCHQ